MKITKKSKEISFVVEQDLSSSLYILQRMRLSNLYANRNPVRADRHHLKAQTNGHTIIIFYKECVYLPIETLCDIRKTVITYVGRIGSHRFYRPVG